LSRGSSDELQTFIGNMVIGGKDAPTPADGTGFLREADFARLRIIGTERLDDGPAHTVERGEEVRSGTQQGPGICPSLYFGDSG